MHDSADAGRERQLHDALASGLNAAGRTLDADMRRRLVQFVLLLARWNAVYNLTAVREPLGMVSRHLLDSLAIETYLQGTRIIDVGTGAGLPGIPLAVVRPDCQFALLDANSKKTRFVTQAAAELGLKNVAVVHSRVEDYRPAQSFDTVVTRAYAKVATMLGQTAHLGGPNCIYLAMKGASPVGERDGVPADFVVQGIEKLVIPGLNAERHVVIVRRR
ncbi:MAG: 16S rRNA (guanine(527)-N(7))-methyltransferase RsmG [Pseudomonadota bacterium]|nr:MAG: 16S rRNA (guanine(527)-N(7))-methyltransferase RsmG [Pseudomonadota bacterium]